MAAGLSQRQGEPVPWPAFTRDVVSAIWSVLSLPAVFNDEPSPFSKCADMTYDMGLGAASVNGVEVTAARP